MKKKKQRSFRQRSCLPVEIRPSSATYDPDEMRSLHQQIFLRQNAWQTELSGCSYFAHYRSFGKFRLLFGKFREVSSFYRNSMFF